MPHEPLSSISSEAQTPSLFAPVALTEAEASVVVPSASTKEDKKVTKAISRLGRGSRVREPALRALQGLAPLSLDPLHEALRQPVSSRWQETQIVLWTLGRAPLSLEQKVEAVAAVTRVLEVTFYRSPLHRMLWTKIALLTSVFIAACFSLIAAATGQLKGISTGELVAVTVLLTAMFSVILACFLVPIPNVIDWVKENRRCRIRATAIKTLGRLAGQESVNVLTSVLEDSAHAVREEALRILLPLLTREHCGQLPSYAIAAICVDMEYKTEEDVLKRLDALEAVGNSQALRTIKHMQHYGRTERVRHKATQVATVLVERQAQENAPKMLLRASSAVVAAPDTLLRAASGDSVSDPNQLLRAVSSEETSG